LELDAARGPHQICRRVMEVALGRSPDPRADECCAQFGISVRLRRRPASRRTCRQPAIRRITCMQKFIGLQEPTRSFFFANRQLLLGFAGRAKEACGCLPEPAWMGCSSTLWLYRHESQCSSEQILNKFPYRPRRCLTNWCHQAKQWHNSWLNYTKSVQNQASVSSQRRHIVLLTMSTLKRKVTN